MKHKFMTTIFALVLVAGLAASVASAKDGDPEGVPFNASITAAYTGIANPGFSFANPPTTPPSGTGGERHCGDLDLPALVTAHGYGSSSLGSFSFELTKTMGFGQMRGCAALMARNGHILYADYAGTTITGGGAGTLTFTGGTGKFHGATGSATFKGAFVGPAMAFYLVEGTVYLAEDDDDD